MAVGTVTITEKTYSMIKKITFDWTAVASGDASIDTTNVYDGEVLRIVCPALTASACGYGVKLNDNDGIDLLGSQGIDVPVGGLDFGTSTGALTIGPHLSVVSSKISLAVTGSSGSNTGQTIVYVR